MKRLIKILILISLSFFNGNHPYQTGMVHAQPPSGAEILERVDQNMSSETRVFSSKMLIHGRRGSRTVVSKSWAEGEEKAFTEYPAPAREKGRLKEVMSVFIYANPPRESDNEDP